MKCLIFVVDFFLPKQLPRLPQWMLRHCTDDKCEKKYSYNVLKFIFDMGANQDLISVLICINPDI
jgi:hypothetical protein